ncbi:MAG: hypothetical protein WC641_04855 [Patescibacteria group bacterium]
MKRRLLLILLLIAAAAVLVAYSAKLKFNITAPFAKPAAPTIPDKGITVFVARICTYCHAVDRYIVSNGLDKKGVDLKDIETDKPNETLFYKIAARCKLSAVTPLLWDGKQCAAGEEKVLEYLGKLK